MHRLLPLLGADMERPMQDIVGSAQLQSDPSIMLQDHGYQHTTTAAGGGGDDQYPIGQAMQQQQQPGHGPQQWQAHAPQQEQQPQQQQPVQQPWSQHQVQHKVQQQQQQHHQQQQQTTTNKQTLVGEADRRKSLLLSDYVPPAAYTQLNVPVLMQQTAAAITKWGELQQSLDVKSDAAPANLAAQAQVRSSLKRDLTNLTQLADAQTKHTQRMKMRHMQAMAMKAPAQGGFRGGGGGGGGDGGVVGGAAGAAALSEARGGGAAPAGEGYSNQPPKRQVPLQQPPGTLAPQPPHPAGAVQPAHYAASGGSAGAAVLPQQGGGGGGTPGGVAPPQAQSSRLQGIRQRIDRTEPVNKWVVLVEASLRLPPADGPTFKQFTFMIQNLLTSYNGDVGAEVARALGTCLDPRVFDPMDIKRAQERMADLYSRFRRSSQRC